MTKIEFRPVEVGQSFTDIARSLGRIEGMQTAQTDALAHLLERLDAITDSKMDKSTFWKVIAPLQGLLMTAAAALARMV